MLPIVPLQRCLKLLQPLGTIICVYWFDSQVMLGVCCVHMAQPLSLAVGCPRVLALKQRSFFFPVLIPSNWVDRFIGFLLSSCQLIVLQWFKLWHWWDSVLRIGLLREMGLSGSVNAHVCGRLCKMCVAVVWEKEVAMLCWRTRPDSQIHSE